MHTTIDSVMTTSLVTCPSTATATEVARQMRDHDIGDVLVVDGDRLVGIVTDRDIVVRGLADGGDGTTPVSSLMSKDVQCVSTDASPADVARLMADRAIRRIPVVDDGRPVGIVSLGDLAEDQSPDTVLGEISDAPPNN